MRAVDHEAYSARFQLIHEVGCGASGRVEKVYDREAKQVKAVKIIPFADSPEELEEVQLLQSLKHTNIVKFFESFALGQELMIVMEYCGNGNLSKLKSSMTELLLLAIIADVASALAYIHERNMIHFDVKPQNILLSSIGEIRLSDFGISRHADSRTVQAECRKPGTVLYMSPEMLQGKPATSAVDVWALGITAFEMVVGIPIGLTDCANFAEWIAKNQHRFADGKPWSQAGVALMRRMLDPNARTRITCAEILKLPIIQDCPPTWFLTAGLMDRASEIFWDDE
jgi:serine/threonine protein kinase